MRLSIVTGTILAAGLLGAAVLAGASAPPADGAGPSGDRLKRGEYLTTIMDCAGCHTPGVFLGKPDRQRVLGGSEVGFQLPGLGTFFPPNLTPDPETGLGKWTEAQLVAALRKGVRPDGRILAPIMPYNHYSKLTDDDALAIAAYLKSLKPVRHQVPEITGPSEKPRAPHLTVVMPD
jgi:mono/diheme cytochrome c family protein